MFKPFFKILLLSFGVSQQVFAAPTSWVPGFLAQYGSTPDSWNAYKTVKANKDNVPALLSLLRSNYGTYQGVFAATGLSLEKIPVRASWLDYIDFYVRAEAVGAAEVHNPVLPELSVSLADAIFFETNGEYFFPKENLLINLGISYGQGRETRIEGFVTDFLENTPRRLAHFNVYGFDLGVDHGYRWAKNLKQVTMFRFKPSFFSSTIADNSFVLGDAKPRAKTFRSKLRTSTNFETFESGLVPQEIGPELVIGPQPLPIEVFPRIWEYTHQIYSNPEYGAMLGGGLLAKWGRGPYHCRMRGGLYAGYWGAFLGLSRAETVLDLGSAGVEESAAYKTKGQRYWLANLGIKF